MLSFCVFFTVRVQIYCTIVAECEYVIVDVVARLLRRSAMLRDLTVPGDVSVFLGSHNAWWHQLLLHCAVSTAVDSWVKRKDCPLQCSLTIGTGVFARPGEPLSHRTACAADGRGAEWAPVPAPVP